MTDKCARDQGVPKGRKLVAGFGKRGIQQASDIIIPTR